MQISDPSWAQSVFLKGPFIASGAAGYAFQQTANVEAELFFACSGWNVSAHN
jgi:hypothetical protein